jgi:hypothetical protein
MTAGRIGRELWWPNEEFSLIDLIPSSLSMVIYHLWDEKISPLVAAVQWRILTPAT